MTIPAVMAGDGEGMDALTHETTTPCSAAEKAWTMEYDSLEAAIPSAGCGPMGGPTQLGEPPPPPTNPFPMECGGGEVGRVDIWEAPPKPPGAPPPVPNPTPMTYGGG